MLENFILLFEQPVLVSLIKATRFGVRECYTRFWKSYPKPICIKMWIYACTNLGWSKFWKVDINAMLQMKHNFWSHLLFRWRVTAKTFYCFGPRSAQPSPIFTRKFAGYKMTSNQVGFDIACSDKMTSYISLSYLYLVYCSTCVHYLILNQSKYKESPTNEQRQQKPTGT